jgi:hypothetical protein
VSENKEEDGENYTMMSFIICRMRWVWHVVHMGKMRYKYKIVVRKPQGKRLLGRSMKDNTKMDINETDYEAMEQI